MYKILVINPGSTSTKVAVALDNEIVFEEVIRHSTEELKDFSREVEQGEFRKEVIIKLLKENGYEIKSFDAVAARGGILKALESGTYKVTDFMVEELKSGKYSEHASNLGAIIAMDIYNEFGIAGYITDPVVVDEMQAVARISGMNGIERKSIFHALNQKAVAKEYAKDLARDYNELNLIVVHMGGGVSVGAHHMGRVVDVNNAVDGDGPFSPERSGAVPIGDLVKMAYEGRSHSEIKKLIKGNGGFNSYLGSNNLIEIIKRAEEDSYTKLILDGFCYQIAKEIGAYGAVLKGRIDGILLTGGIAYSEHIVGKISEYISYLGPVVTYPGEDEMRALAMGTLSVLDGNDNAKEYR